MTGKRTVVILGAGASIEFLSCSSDNSLTTRKLTYILSENLVDFMRYIENHFGKNDIFWVKDFLFEIITSLRKYFGNTFNFEHVIQMIDIVADMHVSKYINLFGKIDINVNNIYLPLIDLFGGKIDPYLGKILSNFPVAVRYFILDYICDHYFPGNRTDLNLWKNSILNIAKNGNLSIFSLNYDSLLYEVIACINKDYINKNNNGAKCYIETGVKIEELSGNGWTDLDLIKIREAANVFVPLHGSIHFVPGINGVKFYRNCSDAKEKRKGIWVSLKDKPDGSSDYNQIMITGLSKFDSIAKEPFSTFYIRAVEDIMKADRIFIIGYGGADQHLNMLIKSSNAKQIHYVTKLDNEYFDSYLRLLDDEIILTWRRFLPEDFFENLNDRITNKISIKNKYFVYPKGTKYFLQRSYRMR